MQDIFYKVRIPLETKRAICDAAMKVATIWWVDQLDCKVSFSRQSIESTYDEIIAKLTGGCHFVVIHRMGGEEYGEIGFSTMCARIDYFLWIHTTVEDLHKIVKQFNLEAMS